MSTTFYLVRHAIKEKGSQDVGLTPEGVQQARKTAERFRQLPIQHIVSSPLRRAKLTAALIAEATNLTVSEDRRLRERANWGDLPGQSFEAFVAMWERCTQDRDYSPPVGDSARKAGERLSSCLSELSERYPADHLIVVTHGGLITDFLVNVFCVEELYLKHPHFIAEQSHLIAECSITEIRCKGGIFEWVSFADTRHLHTKDS